jgi:hypothetical protein
LPSNTTDAVNALLSTARDQMGIPYKWGGTSRAGFDCSGFTTYVFAKHGISLPRTALEQSQRGVVVQRADLQAGDLLFFKTSSRARVTHVGIYIGNNNFIHASSGGGSVRYSSLDEDYYNRCYVGARRIVGVSSNVTNYVGYDVPNDFDAVNNPAVKRQQNAARTYSGGSVAPSNSRMQGDIGHMPVVPVVPGTLHGQIGGHTEPSKPATAPNRAPAAPVKGADIIAR